MWNQWGFLLPMEVHQISLSNWSTSHVKFVDFVPVPLLVRGHRELRAEEEIADGVQQRLRERHRMTAGVVVVCR